MADIYGQKHSAGDNFKALLKEEFMGSDAETHSSWLFDHSKVSLIYAHAHRVAVLNSDFDRIVIDYYDDCKHIIHAVYDFFVKNPRCLPQNTELCIHRYNGVHLSHLNPIQGSGFVDKHYDWSVRCMAYMAGYSDMRDPLQKTPQSYNELRSYHKSNAYFKDDSPRLLIDNKFDVSKFLSFRENQIPNLHSREALTKSGYCTALDLFEQNLIPAKLIYKNPLFVKNPAPDFIKREEALNEENEEPKKSYCCFHFFRKKNHHYAKLDGSLELNAIENVS